MNKRGQGLPLETIVKALLALLVVGVIIYVFIYPIPKYGRDTDSIVSSFNECICDTVGKSGVCAAGNPNDQQFEDKKKPAQCTDGWKDCDTNCWKLITGDSN